MTKKEQERGYTDAQREEALRSEHMKSPSPWMRVVSNPWPNKKKNQSDRT